MLLAIKSPFQLYIVCWGQVRPSKIIGGGGGGGERPAPPHLLFCNLQKCAYCIGCNQGDQVRGGNERCPLIGKL